MYLLCMASLDTITKLTLGFLTSLKFTHNPQIGDPKKPCIYPKPVCNQTEEKRQRWQARARRSNTQGEQGQGWVTFSHT